MAATTAIAIGGAAAGGAALGAIKGKQGTKDQVVNSTSKMTFDPKSAQQLGLERQSYDQYLQALSQQEALEKSFLGGSGLDAIQAQARMASQGILSGDSFGLTPQESQLIESQRMGVINQGEADINRFLEERLAQVQQSAGTRGLRGQAVTSLQGDVLKEGALQQGNVVRQANQMAMERQAQAPLQRIQAQSPFIQQGFTSADVLRQQAMANRASLQNPLLLQQLQQERMASGTQTGQQMTPGQKGSWTDALTGGLTGGLQGAQIGSNVASGMGAMGGGGGMTGGGQQANTLQGFSSVANNNTRIGGGQ